MFCITSKISRPLKTNGFTLLELIIVIIIVGVLASLALPRLTTVIERSRAVEAVNALTIMRDHIENCRQANGGESYDPTNCVVISGSDWVVPGSGMKLSDIFQGVNHHFEFTGSAVVGGTPFQWYIYVRRNSHENSNDPGSPSGLNCQWGSAVSPGPESMIGICTDEVAKTVKVVGSGYYEGI